MQKDNPTEREIDALHAEYCKALVDLFETHKSLHDIPKDVHLNLYWSLILYEIVSNVMHCMLYVMSSYIDIIKIIINRLSFLTSTFSMIQCAFVLWATITGWHPTSPERKEIEVRTNQAMSENLSLALCSSYTRSAKIKVKNAVVGEISLPPTEWHVFSLIHLFIARHEHNHD